MPSGACIIADNLVANKDGTAETRRGIYAASNTFFSIDGNWVQNIFGYQNRLLSFVGGFVNDAAQGFYYDSTGTLNLTQSATGLTLTATNYLSTTEANKNMYAVGLDQGVYKFAAYNTAPTPSGVSPALDGTGVLAGAGSGFLGAAFQCVYQIVFGYTDVNGNLNLGAPSQRILVTNSTGGADNVTLTFTVPQGLSTSYFYQVYRTPQTAYSATPSLNVPPGAEPQLSAQYNLTGGQVSALSVTFTDVTTDPLLGAACYTNPSQQGSLQANLQPPFATDSCLFSQMMFYSNCHTLQTLTTNMISVGTPNGIQLNDTVTVNSIVFTAKAAQNNGSQQFAFVTSGTVAQNIDTTARNLVACINANAATTHVYAYYTSGYNGLPGQMQFSAINIITAAFTVTTSRLTAFSPALPITSTNDSLPNGIFVSKVGQPEAVPAVNIVFVGGGDQPIYRVLALRDRVIVLKSDGVFVISGSTPQTLSVTLLDSTIICIAPASARLLNNSVYCMTQQGVVSITDSGVTIQSRAIESQLLSITTVTYLNKPFSQLANATSYESERLYILQLPSSNVDKWPTQCFCFNWITNTWTHWPIDMACGFVNPFDNVLYCARPSEVQNQIYKERKTYNYSDYIDDEYPVVITGVTPTATGAVISLSSTPSLSWVGDWLDQGSNLQAILTTNGSISFNTDGSPITVECLGAGGLPGPGGGGGITDSGAGGGEYRKSVIPYISGTLTNFIVGVAQVFGATATSWNGGQVLANGGNYYHGGIGGTGTVGFNGGDGGAGDSVTFSGSGGGGGAAGPHGAGGHGGNAIASGDGSGGGGGADGGSNGQDGGASANGAGGNNYLGAGSGAAGAPTGSGSDGSAGGGGGGGGKANGVIGGNGSADVFGSGGGGGGANNLLNTGGGQVVPNLGYGGGAGYGRTSYASGPGLIVVTYNQNAKYALITSVDTIGNTITISLQHSSTPGVQIAWVNAAAQIDVPIPTQIQLAPITGNFPHYTKTWGRINYWFNGGNFNQISYGFVADTTSPTITTNNLAVEYPAASQSVSFPLAVQSITSPGLARWIEPVLQQSVPYCRLSFVGVTASYEIVSDVMA